MTVHRSAIGAAATDAAATSPAHAPDAAAPARAVPLAPSFDLAAPAAAAVPASAPAIRLRGVGKRFGAGPVVLDDISLEVAPGGFVCLIGASGCGKSTLLNLVAGLDRPTAGTVETPAAGAALMFQESALMPWLTASRNIELALRLRGVARAHRRSRARELLDVVGLGDAADKRPHELSGGMRQRVALARALAQERPVLLMDEPFAALDAITRDLLHEELERVWRATGRTIVFVTHNVAEAVRLGERIVLLSSRPGRVVGEWATAGRRSDAQAAALSTEITDRLRTEIRRNAA